MQISLYSDDEIKKINATGYHLRVFVILLALIILPNNNIGAQSINSVGDGNWSSRSVWNKVTGTGQITYSKNSTAVTGTGTSFTTELTAGDIIITDKGSAISIAVASITDDTLLTLVSAPSKDGGPRSYWINRLPKASDDIHIIYGSDITVDITNAQCNTLTIGVSGAKNGSLVFNPNAQLMVNSSVTMNDAGNNKTLHLDMANGGTLICASLSVPATGGTQKFTAGAGTVILTASNTLPATVFTTFNNLTLQSGTTTLGSNINIAGTLTLAGNGSLNASSYAVSYGTTGSLAYQGSSAQTAAVNEFPTSNGPVNLYIKNSSGVDFALQRIVSGNMIIDSNAVCRINTCGQLTVSETLTNNAGNGGLVIESTSSGTGSLIHNTNNVPMTIQRFVSGFDYTSGTLSNKKYHCVSVPLVPANNSLSGLFMGSYLYDYNPSTNAFIPWSAPTTTPMDETEGFMIFYPHSSGTTYNFAGEANNGTFTCNTSAATPGDSGFYLVPNPYPSSIDWNAASGWTKTNLENNVWIWNSESQNYAVWNGTVGINEGSPYIPVGQSFFVQSNGDSPELIMNNNARLHNNTAFFKNQIFMPSCLVLQAETHSGSDETMMYFDIAGTPAEKIIGFNGPPKLYCYSGFQKLSIQSLPELTLPCSVDVGFEMTSDSLVTISAKGMDGFDTDICIILEDLLTGQLIDLRTHPVFTFTHQTSNPKNRFRVHFSNLTNNITFIEHSYKIYNTDQYIVLDIPSLVGKEAMI
ncbi:MAG TPA: hypothetical protein PLZ67_04185, partial [Bacteroidales bacterium]|nr:hypothetical protein [Bacteroidales bacterium]